MKLEDFQVATMCRALEIYLEIAWAEQAESKWPDSVDCKSAASVQEFLKGFVDATGDKHMRKYTLRLGNKRYPFMKLVFQELLIRDSFFFAVDTHDELDIKDTFPDYEEWLEIKRFNASLREQIERTWNTYDIPTFASVIVEVERLTPRRASMDDNQPLVMVVDDEPDISRGVQTFLNRSGFRTIGAASAEEALEMLQGERPDLILSDLEMGGMTGLDFAMQIRKNPRWKRIPFILATAATVGSSNFRVIDGYLVKPFDTNVLLKFVSQHLRPKKQ